MGKTLSGFCVRWSRVRAECASVVDKCTLYAYTIQSLSAALTIRFDPNSDVPAIRQITERLRVLLVENKLLPGTSLPPVRRLAMELGVHFNTVAAAYRELAEEGWLDLRHGRGALVVARAVRTVQGKAWLDEFRDELRGLIARMLAEGAGAAEIAAELRAASKTVTRL